MQPTSLQAASDGPSATSSVIISILNWNSASVTLECLKSIAALRPDPGVALPVFVIDNGSREAGCQRLQQGMQRDGMTLRPPRLDRRVPRLFDLLRRLLLIQHARHMATT